MSDALAVPGPIEDVEEVRVLEWHGEPGRVFTAGELVVEFETHKALVEVRAGQSGVLRKLLCEAGDWQAIGLPVALFSDAEDEPVPDETEGLAALTVDFEVS